MKGARFSLLIVILLLPAVVAADELEDLYQQLKQDYVTFLADARAQRDRAQWHHHIRAFLSFTEKHPAHRRAPDALFVAGDAYVRMGYRSGRLDDFREAVKVYDRLARTYPQSSLADDALIKAAMLLEQKLGDPQAARQRYQTVLDQFEDGDQLEAARQGLSRLGTQPPEHSPEPPADATPHLNPIAPQRRDTDSRTFTVVLDPGHGGDDSGADTERIIEKKIALELVRRIRGRLLSRSNLRVLLTREDDYYLAIDLRAYIANEARADAFVSVHVNASDTAATNGIETFIYSAEGEPSGSTSNHLQPVLLPPADPILNQSWRLAQDVHYSLLAAARKVRPPSNDRGVKPAALALLANARVPATLVETGFSTYAEEAALLTEPRYWDVLAAGIADGILRYLDSLPSPGN
jgi:N-acetylmuramoyl-L-alanine amidase